MNITKTHNINFKGIYVADERIPELLYEANHSFPYTQSYRIFREKLKRVGKYQNSDVFVLKDGTVYAKRGNEKVVIQNNKPLLHKFYLALTYAQYMEDTATKKEN